MLLKPQETFQLHDCASKLSLEGNGETLQFLRLQHIKRRFLFKRWDNNMLTKLISPTNSAYRGVYTLHVHVHVPHIHVSSLSLLEVLQG